ncbi:MAG: glutamine--fructose-6-phosphate transaminase (isomerizing) [Bacteroidota bacterium]
MCGIIGYVGAKQAADILVNGLKRLEYRGYDSAGVAVLNGHGLQTRRVAGRVAELEAALEAQPAPGATGIAHTRWATHGPPTERNAHPHLDASGRIALVHNGIIENHAALRTYLEEQGVVFHSETDTEVLVHLVGLLYHDLGDLLEAVRNALREVVGTYGVAVVSADEPGTLVAARRGSPLIVGLGEDEFLIASDGNALVEHTRQVIYLKDHEIVRLGPDGMTLSTIDAEPVAPAVEELETTLEQIELAGYEHHMLKEIDEQPEALRTTLRGRIDLRKGRVHLGGLVGLESELARCRRLLLTGCGTAWHAALVGEYLFEELVRVPTEVEYASELRYRNPIIEEGTLGLVISQSGETADTLAALEEIQTKGATALGIVNVVGSTIARETDAGVYLRVGPEIGVASTKAFTAQLAVLTLLAVDMGRRRHLSPARTAVLLDALRAIPDQVEVALQLKDQVRALVEQLVERDNWLYLGRGVNYPVALEGALKLKEISYIHAEGLPAAEMKHGPIALIDAGMPVVVVAPQDHLTDKVRSNIEEIRSRRGRVVAIATEGDHEIAAIADDVLTVPRTLPLLSPFLTTIPLQLIAYYAALIRGHDVDKPRNLAKSVTVE